MAYALMAGNVCDVKAVPALLEDIRCIATGCDELPAKFLSEVALATALVFWL